MKNYIVGYALLAMVSTALVQTMQAAQEEQLKLVVKKADILKDKNVFYMLGFMDKNNRLNEIASLNEIELATTDEQTLFLDPKRKTVLLVSSAQNGDLVLGGTFGFSITDLRRNANIEFKVIPTNCTKGTVVCTISQGRIGKLKIDVNTHDATCTPTSKAGKAYAAAKEKARDYAADASEYAREMGGVVKQTAVEAGSYVSGKAKKAGTYVSRKAGQAGSYVSRQAESAKRGFGRGLKSAGGAMTATGEMWAGTEPVEQQQVVSE